MGDGEGETMTSTVMMYGLIVFYLLTAMVSAWEGNWPRGLYWVGASIISVAVLWGTK